jgi:GDPmannose 4,6-dehydratase
VALSFDQPFECMESIARGNLILLGVIRYLDRPDRFFNAGGSDCFGDTGKTPADERLCSAHAPYGVTKAAAFWQVANYREAYGLFACIGIMANHE